MQWKFVYYNIMHFCSQILLFSLVLVLVFYWTNYEWCSRNLIEVKLFRQLVSSMSSEVCDQEVELRGGTYTLAILGFSL